MSELAGVIPPLVTPFHADESLDLVSLERMVDRVLSGGVHAVFVLGSQGEFFALTAEEQREVIRATVSAASGRAPVLAGTTAISTAEAVRLAVQAQKLGCDGIVVLPPFYITPVERELEAHFMAVARAVDVPVILYNHPRTGTLIPSSLVASLAELPNVIAIKDSSANFNQTVEYLSVAPDGFHVFVGNDSQIAYAVLAGASGAVSATANIVPELCVEIYDMARAGRVEEAVSAQQRLSVLRKAFELGTFPSVVKEALALVGEPVGFCRRPVGRLSEQAVEELRSVLKTIGCLPHADGA